MVDYESAAYTSVQRMRENHDLEVVSLRNDFMNKYHHLNLSKKCCNLRLQEKKCFAAKEYMKANQLRQQADELEIIEIQMHQEKINQSLEKEENKLRKTQSMKLNSLLRRIQRDRDE